MAQASKGTGLLFGIAASCALFTMAAATIVTGDVRMQLAGLDVSISNQSERGFIVKIDGAECPGAACPAFALDWKLAGRG